MDLTRQGNGLCCKLKLSRKTYNLRSPSKDGLFIFTAKNGEVEFVAELKLGDWESGDWELGL
jgi:hypothetical protein